MYLENEGFSVVLMGFCSSEGDDVAVDRICENKELKHTYKYIHRNINESLAVIKGADIVFATRFHAMVVGWAFAKKVVPIAYGNKMRNVIRDSHFDGCCVDIEELDNYNPEHVLANAGQLRDVSFFVNDSLKQFEGFDKWVESIR